MHHMQLIILGTISVIFVLILQVFLSVLLSAFGIDSFSLFSYDNTGLLLIVTLIAAALSEEVVRIGMIWFYHVRILTTSTETRISYLSYGLTYGLAFGVTEGFLVFDRLSSLEISSIIGIVGVIILHTILSIVAFTFIAHKRAPIYLALLFILLIGLHVAYNALVYFIF